MEERKNYTNVNLVKGVSINRNVVRKCRSVLSGNGLARHLHYQIEAQKGDKIVTSKEMVSSVIDYGKINEVPCFVLPAGVGFDAFCQPEVCKGGREALLPI